MTVVFDYPDRATVRHTVQLTNGQIIEMTPPNDVLDEISSHVYNLIVPLIKRENRKLYEGVPEDDGWALLARIKSTEAELGSYLDLLESKRDDLACGSLNEYPSFKAAVTQLRMDWQSAIDNSLIDADEDWPLSKVKQFVADRLSPLLGDSIGEWVENTAHRTKSLDDFFVVTDAVYKAKVRRLRRRRQNASVQLAALASPQDDDGLAAADQQLYARAEQGSSSRPAKRVKFANVEDHRDRPPSWLQPMMTAMAATFAQALAQQQQSWNHAPRTRGDRGDRGRGRGNRRGRGGRGGGYSGRGGGYDRSRHSQQYLQDSDMEDAADVDYFNDAFGGHQDDDNFDHQE